ncbi:MAG: hypothetical protein FJ264_00810 [Planctomycetes bacterium]|nr:hypothetical protein [Planctomycetota bacterium]
METKKIKQIDARSGEVLNIFSSLSEASKFTGVSKATISYCINKKKGSGRGFVWEIIENAGEMRRSSSLFVNKVMGKRICANKLKKIKQQHKKAKIRKCLLCDKIFVSIDPANRRCGKCNSDIEHAKDSFTVYRCKFFFLALFHPFFLLKMYFKVINGIN